MTKRILFLVLGVLLAVWVISCSKGADQKSGNQQTPPATSCDGISAKFAADISPIIQTRCATSPGCHGSGSSNGPGALVNFSQIQNAAFNIKAAVVSGQMPLGSTLSSAQIAEISCWVDNGALNN